MRIIFTTLLIAISFFAFSQKVPTIVSTEASNRNILIEEYTGINCQFCPCGHKVVNKLIELNPGIVYGINIHQGPFANTTPNYTTSFGNTIATQVVSGSYPIGSVNRHSFGTTMAVDYVDFGSKAVEISNMTSPVNIAVKVLSLDYVSRVAKILVEVYYTANSTATTNSVNLAVIQNNILGKQIVNSACSYPENMVGSQYKHNHMLRHMITGAWGITIPSNTAGTFWDSTFTYTIPEKYSDIPAELSNLEFLAFVTEGRKEVLKCHGVKAPGYPTDASISKVIVPNFTCDSTILPKVILSNPSQTELTSVKIVYYIDENDTDTLFWTGNLACDSTIEVTLDQIKLSTSGKNIIYAKTYGFNDDVDPINSNDMSSASTTLIPSSSSDAVSEAFTNASTFPAANMVITPGGYKTWERSTKGHYAAGSAMINFYNIGIGQKDYLMVYPLDLTGKTGVGISFWIAYKQYDSTSDDRLDIEVSTDCGETWTSIWSKSGSNLATAAAQTAEYKSPIAADWKQWNIPLTAYEGKDNIMIRFASTCGYGNNLYLDDINISNTSSVNELNLNSDISIYPNPSNENANIEFNSTENSSAKVVIYNTIGQIVYSTEKEITEGKNVININTSSFENGIYLVNLLKNDEVIKLKFIVSK